MISAISSEVAKQHRQLVKDSKGDPLWLTEFMGKRTQEKKDQPHAYLAEQTAHFSIPPHFHQVDQFQVFVAGSGSLGRNAIALITVHYVDHHTAYGPLHAGPFGLSMFVFRARMDQGAIYLHKSDYKDFLRPTKKRYIAAENISLSTAVVLEHRNVACSENLFDQADGSDGLGAFMLRLGAGMIIKGPDPRATGGQYYLVVNGSLSLGDMSYPAWSTIYAESTDTPLEVCAGRSGLETLVLNFPRPGS